MNPVKIALSSTCLLISGCFDWTIPSFDDAGHEACECIQGPCCDGCRFLGTETRCDDTPISADEYRCANESCGSNVLQRGIYQHCSGVSAECPTNILREGDWEVFQICTLGQRCVFVGGAPLCHTCVEGCVDGHCAESQCESGPCCDDGHYASSSTPCSETPQRGECRCSDSDCGADVECRTQHRFCTGMSAECTDYHLEWEDWSLVESCSPDQACEVRGDIGYCLDCENGCERGECIEQAAECESGPCCDDGSLRPASHVCSNERSYRCDGTGCGANAQERAITRHCSGTSSTCSGDIINEAWTTIESCFSDDLCSASAYGASCQDCPYGCLQDFDGTDGECAVPVESGLAEPGSICSCDSDCGSVNGHRGACIGGTCIIVPDGNCPVQGGEEGCGPGLYCWTSNIISGYDMTVCWTHCSSTYSCASDYEDDCYCYPKPSTNVYCDPSCATFCY